MHGKRILLTALLLTIAIADQSFALFGAGDIVSDPMSYTYYVEQIKMMTEEIEAAQERLESLNGIKDQADQMRRQLIGTYNTALGAMDRVKKIQEKVTSRSTSLKGYAQSWEDLQDLIDDSEDGYIDARKLIDVTFKDPRLKDYDSEAEVDKREQARQLAIRDAIVEAEELLDDMPAQYQKIEDLISQIDTTENVKHAMDLNNRILVEILEALLDLVKFTTHFGQAQAMQNYNGVSDEGLAYEIEKEEYAIAQGIGGLKVFEDRIKDAGIDPDDITMEDLSRIMTTEIK